MDLDRLKDPFPTDDVEWRIGRAGKKKEGSVWAMCLAYITNRAIMERLDEVVGPENWRNEYREAPAGGVLCGLSIRVGDEWVTKCDGAENTDMEAVKGGLSGAMKRAAVQWGVGRYLYNLPEGWATVSEKGEHYGKTKDGTAFRWDPPELPAWALPGGSGKPEASDRTNVNRDTGEVTPATPAPARATPKPVRETCPACESSEVWDNRPKKRKGEFSAKSPDYACKDKECGWSLWIGDATKKIGNALDLLFNNGTISEEQRSNVLLGVGDGEITSFQKAQDWIATKQEEAREEHEAVGA